LNRWQHGIFFPWDLEEPDTSFPYQFGIDGNVRPSLSVIRVLSSPPVLLWALSSALLSLTVSSLSLLWWFGAFPSTWLGGWEVCSPCGERSFQQPLHSQEQKHCGTSHSPSSSPPLCPLLLPSPPHCLSSVLMALLSLVSPTLICVSLSLPLSLSLCLCHGSWSGEGWVRSALPFEEIEKG
jgi:hypothetical protein